MNFLPIEFYSGTRVHEATSLTGLVPERVQLTVHTTEPTGTVPEPFHCDHTARWSARTGTSGRSGTGLNTGNWNGSGTVLVSNLWCEHGLMNNILFPTVDGRYLEFLAAWDAGRITDAQRAFDEQTNLVLCVRHAELRTKTTTTENNTSTTANSTYIGKYN